MGSLEEAEEYNRHFFIEIRIPGVTLLLDIGLVLLFMGGLI